jgi:thymidine phosphorylase
MLQLAGKASTDEAAAHQAREAIASGAALEKFRQMVTWQGGDANVADDATLLPRAGKTHLVQAKRSGVITAMDALLVGRTAVALGAGRDKKSDAVDLSAGILIHKKPGDAVTAGEPVLELRYNAAARLDGALHLASQAVVIGDQAPPPAPLVMGWVHEHGETMFVGGM